MRITLPINSWRVDPTGLIGAFIMLGFAAIAGWRWYDSGLIFYALTFLRDVAASWFLLTRNADSARRKFGLADLLAYISSATPLMYLSPKEDLSVSLLATSNCFAIVGFAISTIALFELGRSFGVSPANRGKVSSGVYKLFPHPMYFGYGIAEIGMVLLNPINMLIFLASSTLYYSRAKQEDKILSPSLTFRKVPSLPGHGGL